jgi:VanZ family protein
MTPRITNTHSALILFGLLSLSVYASICPESPLFALARGLEGVDKICHFLLLMLCSLSLNVSIKSCEKRGVMSLPTLSLALLFTIDELLQFSIESRTFDLGDLSANLLGVFVGALCSRLLPW